MSQVDGSEVPSPVADSVPERHAPLVDTLTGLGNSPAWGRWCEQHAGQPAMLVVLDCSQFRRVNEAFGHDVGDAVLVQVARALQQAAPAHAHVFRVQGDGFVVVVLPVDRVSVPNFADELAIAASVPLPAGGHLRLSVGSAFGPLNEQLLYVADNLCAQESKRRRYCQG